MLSNLEDNERKRYLDCLRAMIFHEILDVETAFINCVVAVLKILRKKIER